MLKFIVGDLMYKKIGYVIGLLSFVFLFSAFFQNCSKASFKPAVESSSSSESNSSPQPETSENSSNSVASKISVCDDGSCVDTGEQKIYFNNLIGVSLKVSLSKKISDKIVVVLLSNLYNVSAVRKSLVKLELKKNGYVFLTHEDINKPWLCLDSNQSANSTIGGSINCSSQVIMTGTKQKVVEVAQTYRPLTETERVPGQIALNNNCPAESCLFLPNSNLKFVINDLAGSSSGMKIESALKMPSDGRYKLIVKDMEGRGITFLVADPASGFEIHKHVTLFDQRDHGYLCHEPKSDGLAIIKKTSGDAVNCFSSVRYNILNASNGVIVSGSIPFLNVNQMPANASLWAIGDDRYFRTIIKESF